MQNILASFAATTLAMAVEYLSDLPSAISVIPVLFIFAPGSAAVMACIARFRFDAGAMRDTVNQQNLWEAITSQAVTYMLGIYIAQELWKPAVNFKLKRELRRRLKANAAKKSSDSDEVDRRIAAFERASRVNHRTPYSRGQGRERLRLSYLSSNDGYSIRSITSVSNGSGVATDGSGVSTPEVQTGGLFSGLQSLMPSAGASGSSRSEVGSVGRAPSVSSLPAITETGESVYRSNAFAGLGS